MSKFISCKNQWCNGVLDSCKAVLLKIMTGFNLWNLVVLYSYILACNFQNVSLLYTVFPFAKICMWITCSCIKSCTFKSISMCMHIDKRTLKLKYFENVSGASKEEESLLRKLLHSKLVSTKADLEVLQKDPNSPLFSIKSFEGMQL